MSFTVAEIAEKCNCSFKGNGELLILGIAPIETADSSQITFLTNPKYEKLLPNSSAGCIILKPEQCEELEGTFILSHNPYYIFALIAQMFYKPPSVYDGVSEKAFLAENVQVGENVSVFPFVYLSKGVQIGNNVTIYPNVFIGENSRIDDDTLIYANVSIRENVFIGKRVIIHSGTVIGSDGYGFATEKGIHHKIPQTGDVIIEDDVELGACVTIDRGTLGPTCIGKGTKFDNQVHIAHNVSIGENSLVIAQAGISGSTKIGKSVTIAGQSGLAGHLNIGDNVIIAGRSAVINSLKSGSIVSGFIPARDHRKSLRVSASLASLPELIKRVKRLEKLISENENKP